MEIFHPKIGDDITFALTRRLKLYKNVGLALDEAIQCFRVSGRNIIFKNISDSNMQSQCSKIEINIHFNRLSGIYSGRMGWHGFVLFFAPF